MFGLLKHISLYYYTVQVHEGLLLLCGINLNIIDQNIMDESTKTGYSVGGGVLFTVKKVAKCCIRPKKIPCPTEKKLHACAPVLQ